MVLNLAEFKKTFDTQLADQIISIEDVSLNRVKDPHIQKMTRHSFDLIRGGGKRLRPYIVYLTLQTEGCTEKTHWNVLTAIEIFHAFALVHDDIIDRAKNRRSMMTLQEFSRIERGADRIEDIDNSYALLFGDLLFGIAQRHIVRNLSDSKKDKLLEVFHEMVDTVVYGQILDVSFKDKDSVRSEDIYQKNFLKTSSYSFIYPMKIALALSSDSSLHSEEKYEELGKCLGEAFQVRDDVLNYTSGVEISGKDLLTDIEDGQHTNITHYIMTKGSPEEKRLLKQSFGKQLSIKEKESVRSMVIESGALEDAKKHIQESAFQARQIVDSFSVGKDISKAWHDCVDLIEEHV